jgi:hypothetical protein
MAKPRLKKVLESGAGEWPGIAGMDVNQFANVVEGDVPAPRRINFTQTGQSWFWARAETQAQ